MRLTSPELEPLGETAERIREVAIELFAEAGFAHTTVRQIAAVSDVSPGLVIHHFGSKDGLREACDNHVFNTLTELKRAKASSPSLMYDLYADPKFIHYADYLLKAMLDPSGRGQKFFDQYVRTVEQILEEGFEGFTYKQFDDRRAEATMIAMLGLAPLLLEPRMRRALGTKNVHDTMARIAPNLFELYMSGIVATSPGELTQIPPESNPGSQHDPPF